MDLYRDGTIIIIIGVNINIDDLETRYNALKEELTHMYKYKSSNGKLSEPKKILSSRSSLSQHDLFSPKIGKSNKVEV